MSKDKKGISTTDFLQTVLPQAYFDLMDKEDYKLHRRMIKRLTSEIDNDKTIHFKGDIEEFFIHKFNLDKLKNIILKTAANSKGKYLMYRLFFNKEKNFILSSLYNDVDNSPRKNEFTFPDINAYKSMFYDANDRIAKNVYIEPERTDGRMRFCCINVAHNTLLSNLFETLEKHKTQYNYISVWQVLKPLRGVNKGFEVEIVFGGGLSPNERMSLSEDFTRYIQSDIKPLSIFDMVGPSMVGPSSSHTAGANRIGQIARQIIMAMIERGEHVCDVEVRLLGSFRDTGVGHKTPSAIGGGLCGFDTDDAQMIAHGEPQYLKTHGISFGNNIVKFGGYKKGSHADDLRYLSQKNNNIAEIIVHTDTTTHCITGFSVGAGNVEIRYVDKLLKSYINGKTDMYLQGDDIVFTPLAGGKSYPIPRIYKEASTADVPLLPFNTFEELDAYLHTSGKDLIGIICEIEYSLQRSSRDDVYGRMRQYWQLMRSSVRDGVNSRERSLLNLTGGDANRMRAYIGGNALFDNIYGRAAAYATAVNEINAKSGVIVACPTAGSCGIVPGVVMAWHELRGGNDDDKILEALMIAGFFGMILFTDVSTAGADYGCQAEIGAAAAMAASALVYLENGSSTQMIEAFALALKNSLGLICDPVAGLVEIPCVKRNGIYSSLAISAALMALSGVKSFISPDEVVLTMREVGERLNIDYKETGRAGLAKTRDGKQVEADFADEVRKFFE